MAAFGVLGSGDVGQALGRGFARHGWDVMLGTRHPERLKAWRDETGAAVGSFAEAAAHGDPVVLAVRGSAVEAVLAQAGPLDGKLVLDATNPLTSDMPPGLFVGLTDSLGERVQRTIPGAHVVKCFNTVPNAQMVDPAFAEGAPPMMVCGEDAAAKRRTTEILRGVGWPGVVDVGGIEAARWLEALVPLWVRVGVATSEWGHAFRVVR